MKLELKHLDPYRQYNLEVVWNNKISGILYGVGLKDNLFDLTVIEKVDDELVYKKWCLDDTKLVLRPLEEVVQFLNIEGHLEIDSCHLYYCPTTKTIKIFTDGAEWVFSNEVYEYIYGYLFKNHYDVFGLLGVGLAIKKI